MTVMLQEDWSGHPENSELQALDGWTVSSTYASRLDNIQVNATSQLKKVNSSSVVVAFYDSGSSDHYIKTTGVTWETYAGLAVRVIDHDNMITIEGYGANTRVISRIGGVDEVLEIIPIAVLAAHNTEVKTEGDLLKLFVDGVQKGPDVDITGKLSGNNVGIKLKSLSDPAIGPIEVGTLVDNSMTIDAMPQRHIYSIQGANQEHPVSGGYSLVVPVSPVDVRVEDYISAATVFDWTELDATPSADRFSGVVNLPKGNYYKILTRFRANPSVIASTSRIGVGLLVDADGQSNVDQLLGSGNLEAVNDNTAIFDGVDTWALPTNQAITSMLNALAVANNCVVGVVNNSVSGSDIESHLPSGSYYAATAARIAAIGGKFNLFYWGLGETDADSATSYLTHEADLAALYQDRLTQTGQASSTLPMLVVQLGRQEGGTGKDTGWNAVRAAQTNFANVTDNVYISHQTMDLPMQDGLHRDYSGKVQECLRAAATYNSIGGGDSGRGVIPISATVNGTNVEITHNLNGSAGIVLPTNTKDGYELCLESNDFSTLLTINGISTLGNKIILSLDSEPPEKVKLRSQQGQDPDHAKMPTGDKLYNGQAVIVEPIITSLLSIAGIESTLNIDCSGIPDGDYTVVVLDDSRLTPSILKAVNATYEAGSTAPLTLQSVPIGSQTYSLIRGMVTPSEVGDVLKGITS